MITAFADPFDTLFNLQSALEARIASDWLRNQTASRGPFPPINVFQRGDDILAIVELPGLDKNNLQIEAKENTIRISGTSCRTRLDPRRAYCGKLRPLPATRICAVFARRERLADGNLQSSARWIRSRLLYKCRNRTAVDSGTESVICSDAAASLSSNSSAAWADPPWDANR